MAAAGVVVEEVETAVRWRQVPFLAAKAAADG